MSQCVVAAAVSFELGSGALLATTFTNGVNALAWTALVVWAVTAGAVTFRIARARRRIRFASAGQEVQS